MGCAEPILHKIKCSRARTIRAYLSRDAENLSHYGIDNVLVC